MKLRLFKNWWLMTLKGVLAIGFGLVVLIKRYPIIKTSLAQSFGFLVLASGGMIITGAFLNRKNNPRWRWWLIEGIFDLLIGGFFLFQARRAKAYFLIFMAIWAFVIGSIQIITSFRMKIYMERWWIMLLTGVFSVLFSILIFKNPFYENYNLDIVISFGCIVFGLIMVVLSRVLRNIYL